MKKYYFIVVGMCLVMSACGKHVETAEPSEILTVGGTDSSLDGAESDPTKVATESGAKKYTYVPNVFPVYDDGEVHRLMYAADVNYYYYSEFQNISLVDYGYDRISLPQGLLNKTEEQLVSSKTILTSAVKSDVVYNDSTYYSSEDRPVYSVRTPEMYLFRAWKTDYDGEIHTMTLKDFVELLEIGGSVTSDFTDLEILDDGSTRYTCFFKDVMEDGTLYYGKAVVRLYNGHAWCGVFAERDFTDGPLMAEYVLKQSVRYTK